MPTWAKAWLAEMIAELISNYITPELIAKAELAAKKYAVEKLAEYAKSTAWTEIDDHLVEKLKKAWAVG